MVTLIIFLKVKDRFIQLQLILNINVEQPFINRIIANNGSIDIGTAKQLLGSNPTKLDSPFFGLFDADLFAMNPETSEMLVLL